MEATDQEKEQRKQQTKTLQLFDLWERQHTKSESKLKLRESQILFQTLFDPWSLKML